MLCECTIHNTASKNQRGVGKKNWIKWVACIDILYPPRGEDEFNATLKTTVEFKEHCLKSLMRLSYKFWSQFLTYYHLVAS